MNAWRNGGFTLLELLIAVSVFAVVGTLAYGGLQQIMQQQQHTDARAERLTALQKAYTVMRRDLEQMVPRGVRNAYGDEVEPLVGGSGFEGVEFSRVGHANPVGFVRSEIQRVAYIPDQDRLLRRTWRVLDRAQDSEPDEETLIESLSDFRVRFLGEDDEWHDSWPPTVIGAAPTIMPLAVEVQTEFDDLGSLRWLFRVAQMSLITQAPGGGAAGDDDDGTDTDAQDDTDTAAGTDDTDEAQAESAQSDEN